MGSEGELHAAASSEGPSSGSSAEVVDRFTMLCGPVDSLYRREDFPERQCVAAAAVLGVDGVGTSVLLGAAKRVPLGASDAAVLAAESLEFTLGLGPITDCQRTGLPVMVPDCARQGPSSQRWPGFGEQLLADTSFAAVFALPPPRSEPTGATLALYRRQPGPLTGAELEHALAVRSHLMADLLGPEPRGALGPRFRWLDTAPARRRGAVWQALGMAVVELSLSQGEALAMLRAYCLEHGRLLDDVSADLVSGRLFLGEVEL